ncbi:MAG: glycosyltransferase family 39 protein [Chloroflexi bacterium]|nr:glycosyltransferase family 39 protein [Chloroflexota bacterium]
MTQERNSPQGRLITWLALSILLAGTAYYTRRLTAWLAYDDEGGYLYAAWRISLGEVPYRDFLTPQLPVFLYPGALVLGLSNLSVAAARWSMTLYVLGALLLTFLTVRHLWGAWPALLTLALMAIQRDIFWAARFFRPEAPMLFWAALGLYWFVLGYPQRRRGYLCLAGVALGASMMSKLFGALPMAGLGLFLLLDGLRHRNWRDTLFAILCVTLPFTIVVGVVGGLFQGLSGHFVAAVLGHHLRQGSGTPWRQVVLKAFALYGDYVRAQPAYIALSGAGLLWLFWPRPSSQARRPMSGLYAYQLPTVAAFMLMTRSLQERHLTYIVPALAALGGFGLYGLWQRIAGLAAHGGAPALRVGRRVLAWALASAWLALALLPQARHNALVAGWGPDNTAEWVRYLQAHTAPDEYIMSDYPGLNFFARRPAPPIAAGISRGAALSGQILGTQLIQEIEAYGVRMVLLNIAHGSHQFVNLHDYPAFKRYLQTHFHLVERRQYDYRLLEIYAREDLWPGETLRANLGYQLELTGLHWLQQEVAPGDQLQMELRWHGLASMPEDYWVTLRLMDGRGHEWGLGGKQLVDIDRETWWDEKGLERAVLIPTTRWPPDETTLQTFELPVNAGTPPGRYDVLVRVHPEGRWAGVPLLDENGQPIGYDIRLSQAVVRPAPQPPKVERLNLATRLEAALGPDLRLLGYTLSTGEARPGDRPIVKLCWQAGHAPAQDYAVRLRLTDGVKVWAETTAPLASPSYPSSRWPAGEIVCGQYDLGVDRRTPSGEYGVWADLLDDKGQVLDSAQLAALPVRGRERSYTAPIMAQRSGARFGQPGRFTLLGYELSTSALFQGGALTVTLCWRDEMAMDTSYTFFLHLLDEAGRIRGQVDALPCGGTCPTTSWLPGEILVDTYTLAVAADAPPGRYTLALGWYDADTGVRLPGTDVQGQPLPDRRLLLGKGEITLH